jgi:hypothetical protein
MRSTRLVPAFIAACLAATASCSDSSTPTSPSKPASGDGRQMLLVTLTGLIHAADPLAGIRLAVPGEADVALRGTEIGDLVALENDEVEVHGSWDGDAFMVHDFIVRQVGGVDVMDGILTTLYDDETAADPIGYGIYTTSGSLVPLLDPPQDLINYLGNRVWVATSADGKPEAYGVIGAPTTWQPIDNRR